MTGALSQPDDDDNVLPFVPSRKSGTRKIIAEWLALILGLGGVFTIEDVEQMILAKTGVKRVEVDRRLRELREVGYVIANYRTDPTLLPDQHRLVKIGDEIWHPLYRWPQGRTGCPAGVRRAIYMRDGRQCTICGIRDHEEYLDYPGRYARLTIGRILPGSRGGQYSMENCRAECDRCNEAVRDGYDYGGGGLAA